MATIQIGPGAPLSRPPRPSMNPLRSAAFLSRSRLLPPVRRARRFCSPALDPASGRRASVLARSSRVRDRALQALLKEEWLDSLSFPFAQKVWEILPVAEEEAESGSEAESVSDAECVVGIDPDLKGAVSLLKPDGAGFSARVFDTPNMEVIIGNRVRRRLDARSMIQLLQSFGAPIGTTAFIEQSRPVPLDGKQAWWCGGFTYGLWIGILVASGFSVVPVTSRVWKSHFDLYGSSSTKDDSRKVASTLFPSLDSSLKRKKDHGRAEALLIAAYGKGLKLQ